MKSPSNKRFSKQHADAAFARRFDTASKAEGGTKKRVGPRVGKGRDKPWALAWARERGIEVVDAHPANGRWVFEVPA